MVTRVILDWKVCLRQGDIRLNGHQNCSNKARGVCCLDVKGGEVEGLQMPI